MGIIGIKYDGGGGPIPLDTAMAMTNSFVSFDFPAPDPAVEIQEVLIHSRFVVSGGATAPNILIGFKDSNNPFGSNPIAFAPTMITSNGRTLVELVAPLKFYRNTGNNFCHTQFWYGVDTPVAGSAIQIGGEDDTTPNNNFGVLMFAAYA